MIILFVGTALGIKCDHNDFYKLMKYMQYLCCFVCVYNIIENYRTIIKLSSITNSYQVNFSGILANRNQFGEFLFICIIAHLYYNTGNKVSKFDALLYLLQIFCIITTMSRGAIVATIMFAMVYFLYYKKIIVKKPIIIVSMIIIGVFILSNSTVLAFIKNNVIRSEHGTTGRSTIWGIGLSVFAINFYTIFIGNGYYSGVELGKENGLYVDQFHCFYIDTLVSGGIIELIIILSIFLYAIIKVNKCSDKNIKEVCISAYIGFFLLCFVESDSVLSIGYVDMINTIFFITIPLLIGNLSDKSVNSKYINTFESSVAQA